jgi:hypothetical protein
MIHNQGRTRQMRGWSRILMIHHQPERRPGSDSPTARLHLSGIHLACVQYLCSPQSPYAGSPGPSVDALPTARPPGLRRGTRHGVHCGICGRILHCDCFESVQLTGCDRRSRQAAVSSVTECSDLSRGGAVQGRRAHHEVVYPVRDWPARVRPTDP